MTAPIIWDDKQKVTGNRVTVDPITRLEGHGKIEIFLDDKGDVQNAYWQVPELRGFERFCIGRKVTELNQITARLCGRTSTPWLRPTSCADPRPPLRRGTSSVSSDASDSSSVEPSSRPAVRPRTSRPSSVESPPTP